MKISGTMLRDVASLAAAVVIAALLPLMIAMLIVPGLSPYAYAWLLSDKLSAFWTNLFHAVVVGGPFFIVLSRKDRVNWFSCLCVGFLVGTVRGGITLAPYPGGITNASSNGVVTVVDGVVTMAGWSSFAIVILGFGFLGGLCGLAFRTMLKISGYGCGNAVAPATSLIGPGVSKKSTWRVVIVYASVTLISVALLFGWHLPRDHTCHNMARDGKTAFSPALRVALNVAENDLDVLRHFLWEFADAQELSVRGGVREGAQGRKSVNIHLCNDSGVTVDVFMMHNDTRRLPLKGVSLTVFEVREGSEWRRSARSLVARLERKWPNAVTFRGAHDEPMERPKSLDE